MSVAPFLDWSKQHVFKPQKPDMFDPDPNPNICACGLDREHPEHLPPPPPPDPAFMARVRIKAFLDKHAVWRGSLRTLVGRRGPITYNPATIDALPTEEVAQEAIDILWAHADQGQCRGCAEQIFWMRNDAGKAVPYDKDMQIHFATCPQRQQFKKKG